MIYIFAAHPDDLITGCGGTIAKYIRDKKRITSVIFSYGENRNPILDPAYLTRKLITASKKALKILGSKTILLGLSGSKLRKNLNSDTEKRLKKLFRKNHPKLIITHDISSPIPSHKAVAKFVTNIVKDLKIKPQVYTFEVDFPFKLFQRETPKLYVDITSTFEKKQEAIEAFKSHINLNFYQEFISKFRDTIHGRKIGSRQAEVFYKL